MVGQDGNQPVPVPTGIKLHRRSRYLEIIYPEGEVINLPFDYLRVCSPATEKKVSGPKGGNLESKQNAVISSIHPVGTFALQIVFDDGHETNIYSWGRLYDIAINLKKDWLDQNSSMAGITKDREANDEVEGSRTIKILYFDKLAKRLGLENETITLPDEVESIDDLIPWLMTRRGEWERALAGTLKITMNRHFVGVTDQISDGDEIALTLITKKHTH